MKKVLKKELSNIVKFPRQGLSRCQIFEAEYRGDRVIIKAEKEGSLSSVNINDDRFIQEKNILELGLPYAVNLIGHGDDFNGERFFVLEKLFSLSSKLSKDKIQEIANVVFFTVRQLYLHGFYWVSALKHVMLDKNGTPKLIDFNDENNPRSFFLEQKQHYNFMSIVKSLCTKNGVDKEEIINNALRYLVEKEYQSLENVHDPIYIKEYSNIQKRITEKNDVNYNKLAPANRCCVDRAQIIYDNLKEYCDKNKTVLDIGCNTGWFCFYFKEKGFKTTGVDFDLNHWGSDRPDGWRKNVGGKIDFNNLVSEISKLKVNFINVDVNIEYIEKMPKYDIVFALSVLHLYFYQHKFNKEKWIELFQKICEKTNNVFIYEVPNKILSKLELSDFNSLCVFTKNIGKFKSVKIIGHSRESGRPIMFCEK